MKKDRYMVGQKLSDYQMEKIIRAFAEGVSASDFGKSETSAGRAKRAPNTVFYVYKLLRRRLTEIAYFPNPERYFAWSSDPEISLTHESAPSTRRLDEKLNNSETFRGTTKNTYRDRMAEILFRAENASLHPNVIFQDIKTAIKITGPLNAAPRNLDWWGQQRMISLLLQNIKLLRAMHLGDPADLEDQIALRLDHIKQLEASIRQIRKRVREGEKQPPSRKARPKTPKPKI